MAERELRVALTVYDGEEQTIELQSAIHKQRGPGAWDTFEQAKMLVAGLGQMLGLFRRPENAEYPGQPGKKVSAEISAEGVKVPIPAHATHLFIGADESLRLVDGGDTLWAGYPADAFGAPMSAGAAVSRLRDLIATDGRGPMFSGEEILAVLNGDAADHETMTTDEIDRRAMYAPPYDAIESRHTFPTMSGRATCSRCGRVRGDVYVMTQGRVCPGERPVMDRPQA